MIVNTKEMLEKAKCGKYCIPHFNINNLEWTRFILEECDKLKSPVILGVSMSAAEYMGGYKLVVDIVKDLVEHLNIRIPVAIHLDHGSLEDCIKAIDSGFTSVMIDASHYDLKTNILYTNKVVEYAKERNVSVEAEIGQVGTNNDKVLYTDLAEAIEFAKNTNIDSLAPAVGSIHGLYVVEEKLNFELIKQISLGTNLPLVLHGGTGIVDSKIKKAVDCGICKLNINTELQVAWSTAVRNYLNETEIYDPRKIIKAGETAIKQVIANKIEILQSSGRYL